MFSIKIIVNLLCFQFLLVCIIQLLCLGQVAVITISLSFIPESLYVYASTCMQCVCVFCTSRQFSLYAFILLAKDHIELLLFL
jgi:hypothetical protein